MALFTRPETPVEQDVKDLEQLKKQLNDLKKDISEFAKEKTELESLKSRLENLEKKHYVTVKDFAMYAIIAFIVIIILEFLT